ncbi:MAG: tyrosine-type recombinase/integrase [Oscillospiraceae bacterium]|nr:tyrosine-type recombinase/integrase [Oscillospiraceae bacterium]
MLKKNGIKMTFHELRAQFATAMNDLGVRKEILQMLGGWSTSKVLDEVYIRTPQSKLVEGMKVFDDYMNALVTQCKAEKLASKNHTEAQNHTDHHKE